MGDGYQLKEYLTMKKDTLIIIGIILLGICMYGLTLRGATGNPTAFEIRGKLDGHTDAFELSPERGRYAHVASLAETGNFELTKDWAEVAYPDVGISKEEKYFSFFAPGVSYYALPSYLIGSQFGLAQVATFSIESFMSIITLVFIFLIGRKIFALPRWTAFFSVLIYGFASTSWSYAITLYQNAFTACFIVTAFYAVWRYSQNDSRYSFLYSAYAWLAYGLSITVDYPNAILMLPVMLYLAYVSFSVNKAREGYMLSFRFASLVTIVAFMAITGLHFWHNAHYYGKWSNVAGTLKNYVRPVETSTTPLIIPHIETVSTSSKLYTDKTDKSTFVTTILHPNTTPTTTDAVTEKTISGTFHERLMFKGLYVLLISDERGLFFFTPIFLLVFFGVFYRFKQNEADSAITIVPLTLILFNLFLYSAWGDPQGGWAYGPRYLIASMPWMALFVGVALYEWKTSTWRRIITYLLFLYSLGIALLGSLTTNAIPPKSEAVLLQVKKFNFLSNIDYIKDNRSGSFFYKTYIAQHITLLDYFIVIYIFIALLAFMTLYLSTRHHE